ncbi:DUF1405 domain-containing protein [Halalkalibacter urbisdiaboli]|uniref:DUF1405 domain-containing protein n=1 Tax=Halalkalibacter urbisdiaboli TaxID=1960589 RepID=UPI000B44D71F|nr:DUF1405 domain-containing protein [Halalkalibacter urbisdiaboli]
MKLLTLFGTKTMLWIMLLINIPGTIYGYYWYKSQLVETPVRFLLFVPDSPTASLFFVFVLFAFLMKKNWPLIEALAAVTLIKYGIWAVVMNIATGLTGESLTWQNYMLIASHGGMALQAVIYSPYFRIKPVHLLIASVWTIHNDIIDYVFMMHPSLSYSLMPSIHEIGYFTFWLSLFSIFIVYVTVIRNRTYKLEIKA